MELKDYRKLFFEITKGYSSCFFQGKKAFIKHQSTEDLVDFEDVYQHHYDICLKRGLPTDSDLLEQLSNDGTWTEKEEKEIEQQTYFLESLNKNKKNVALKSAIDRINIQIKNAEKELIQLKNKRQSLLSSSAETYSFHRANDYYIYNSFFKNKECTKKLYDQDQFEYLEPHEVTNLVKIYNKFHESFSDKNIKNLAIQDFYKSYYGFTEDVVSFFGAPAIELTNYQINLFLYTRIFKNIFEEYRDNLPPRLEKDPDGLLDYASSSTAREKIKQQIDSDQKGGSTIVGATKEDMEELGINTEHSGPSLNELAKQKGGSLSMEDLMKMSNA